MTLKLGTQTGSLTNHIYSRMTKGQPEPKVGMGATVLYWTDRHAATITHVTVGRTTTHITVQEDTAKRIDQNGLSESQSYEFSPNPEGCAHRFRQGKDGSWHAYEFNTETKRFNKVEGPGLRIGERDHYHDFSF